ncbi:MAG: hypothetical protein PUG14_02000 [Acholeplasmatales bacterium]|jgi:hypothetical protein BBIF_0317|nr:hypothetical protein [Acholeplasmatales bacterium]MDD7394828.1 hypothetical protein [Acholeplasmatales bacterium]MDY4016968.1 hypothetical protein [Bacilli bacterium]HCX07743.1 hypothetical protein [Acholeplasmatales bacterium]
MKTAAYVLGIIGTIAVGWCLIPLIWCIPMLVKVKAAMDGKEKLSVGFKVCYLIFVSLIGGILLLFDKD